MLDRSIRGNAHSMTAETEPDERTEDFGRNLWLLKAPLDIYRLALLNGGELRRWEPFFGFLQQITLRFYMLGICALFEEEKGEGQQVYPLSSLSGILNFVERYPLRCKDPPAEFIEEHCKPDTRLLAELRWE